MVKRGRAQLVLVGAITVAIAILGAVILLNTVHSSPEATAETDTRSVAAAEQTLTEIEGDLERVAKNRTFESLTGDLEFIGEDTDSLEDRVEAYEKQYLNLTTIDGAGITSVEFNEAASDSTAIAINESVREGDDPGLDTLMENADEVRIYIEINSYQFDAGSSQEILRTPVQGNPSLEFEDANDVSVSGWGFESPECDDFSLPIQIEIIDGVGVITDDDGEECQGDFDDATNDDWEDVEDIQLSNLNNLDEFEGGYEIVGFGGECAEADQCFDGFTNPVFNVAFQNPNVAADSQIRLWEDES